MSFTRILPAFALAAVLAAPLAAHAQSTTATPAPAASGAPMMAHPHHHHHRQSLMHMLQSVNLTDAQKQQVATFHAQEVAANKNADATTRHANAAKLRDEVMGVLTPDQKTQMQAMMQRHRGMHPDGGPAPAPSPSAQ